MTPDRPLFSDNPDERALLEFYDTVPAAELLDLSHHADVSAKDFVEPMASSVQAVALVIERLGATVIDELAVHHRE